MNKKYLAVLIFVSHMSLALQIHHTSVVVATGKSGDSCNSDSMRNAVKREISVAKAQYGTMLDEVMVQDCKESEVQMYVGRTAPTTRLTFIYNDRADSELLSK